MVTKRVVKFCLSLLPLESNDVKGVSLSFHDPLLYFTESIGGGCEAQKITSYAHARMKINQNNMAVYAMAIGLDIHVWI